MNTENFDLIIKVDEKNLSDENQEEKVLEQIGNQIKKLTSYYIKETEFFNIFMVELAKNDLKTALKLAKSSNHDDYEVIPIESVVLTRPGKILNQIINMSKNRIKDGESFTIRCNILGKRYIKNKEEFINTVYKEIEKLNGKPDGTHPDWIIHIEVIGENTGVSVLKRK